jgi:Domain of unknown function (DUF4389)
MAHQQAQEHPVRLINNDDLRRSRLTVFFRLFLVIPHALWLALWGIAVYIAGFVGWLVAIFTGRLPDGIHAFIARYARYFTHVYAYAHLLADPFPPFGSSSGYPVALEIDSREVQNRLTILLRLVLAIPAFLLAYVFRTLMSVLAFVGWFYALATGRMSEGIESLGNYALRYEAQTLAYTFLLTGKYPSLGGGPTA